MLTATIVTAIAVEVTTHSFASVRRQHSSSWLEQLFYLNQLTGNNPHNLGLGEIHVALDAAALQYTLALGYGVCIGIVIGPFFRSIFLEILIFNMARHRMCITNNMVSPAVRVAQVTWE